MSGAWDPTWDLDLLLARADNADIGLCDELAAALRSLRAILTKIMNPESPYGQHYVDLDYGIFDTNADLTDGEQAFLSSLISHE